MALNWGILLRALNRGKGVEPIAYPYLSKMNRYKISATGKLALGIGGVAAAFAAALLNIFRALVASTGTTPQEQRSIQDAGLVGDYNFRTQQFDAGNDPAGWYEDER